MVTATIEHEHAEEYKDRIGDMIGSNSYSDLFNTRFDKLHEGALYSCAERFRRDVKYPEDRLDIATSIYVGWTRSPWIGQIYRQRARDIDNDILEDLETKVNELIYKKRDTLDDNEQTDAFEQLANMIAQAMYIGPEDSQENWKTIEIYLNGVKSQSKDNKKTALDDVKECLKAGNVMGAKQMIVDIIINYNMRRDQERLTDLLVPDDDDYLHEIAEIFADEYNEELERAGRGHKAIPSHKLADRDTIKGFLSERVKSALTHEQFAVDREHLEDYELN
jgi:hypothetical protein